MLVPIKSNSLASDTRTQNSLERRKGGGGHGSSSSGGRGTSGGKSGSGSSSTGKSGSSGSSSSGKGGSSSSSSGKSGSSGLSSSSTISGGTLPGKSSSMSTYNYGGGRVVTIPSGSAFAGRTQGGSTRDQIYGTSAYGSGYPGLTDRSVYSRGFPFYFWPVVWPVSPTYGHNSYLNDPEYGDPSNSSRPGGSLAQATFNSNSRNSSFVLISDNSTVTSLIPAISNNCSSYLASNSSTSPSRFLSNATGESTALEAVQYYRASSIVLTMTGYNNTGALSNATNASDTPLPPGYDGALLYCLNQTIGQAAPLINGAGIVQPHLGFLALFWVIWYIISSLI